jgi:hypothetical protein
MFKNSVTAIINHRLALFCLFRIHSALEIDPLRITVLSLRFHSTSHWFTHNQNHYFSWYLNPWKIPTPRGPTSFHLLQTATGSLDVPAFPLSLPISLFPRSTCFSTLTMKAAGFPETSLNIYKPTWRQIPVNNYLHLIWIWIWGDHFTPPCCVTVCCIAPYTKHHVRCRDHSKIEINNAAVSCNNLFHLMMASSSRNILSRF